MFALETIDEMTECELSVPVRESQREEVRGTSLANMVAKTLAKPGSGWVSKSVAKSVTSTIGSDGVDSYGLKETFTWSFVNDNSAWVSLDLDDTLRVRINRYSENVSILETTDSAGHVVPFPPNFVVEEVTGGSGIVQLSPNNGQYLVTWFGSYRVVLDGVVVLDLSNAKRLVVRSVVDPDEGDR